MCFVVEVVVESPRGTADAEPKVVLGVALSPAEPGAEIVICVGSDGKELVGHSESVCFESKQFIIGQKPGRIKPLELKQIEYG